MKYSFEYGNQIKPFNKNIQCKCCKSKIEKCYTNLKTKLDYCYLCFICLNFSPKYLDHVILCKSNIKQEEINNYAYYYFQKYHKMPTYYEIDIDAKPVKKISPIHFILNLDDPSYAQYKLFFTKDLNINKLLPSRFGQDYVCLT